MLFFRSLSVSCILILIGTAAASSSAVNWNVPAHHDDAEVGIGYNNLNLLLALRTGYNGNSRGKSGKVGKGDKNGAVTNHNVALAESTYMDSKAQKIYTAKSGKMSKSKRKKKKVFANPKPTTNTSERDYTDSVDHMETADELEDAVVTTSAIGSIRPFAKDDSATTSQGLSVPLFLLSNDILTEDVVGSFTEPANGILNTEDDDMMYTPNSDFCGVDTFTYTLSNGSGSDTATVTINVVCDTAEEEVVVAVATSNPTDAAILDEDSSITSSASLASVTDGVESSESLNDENDVADEDGSTNEEVVVVATSNPTDAVLLDEDSSITSSPSLASVTDRVESSESLNDENDVADEVDSANGDDPTTNLVPIIAGESPTSTDDEDSLGDFPQDGEDGSTIVITSTTMTSSATAGEEVSSDGEDNVIVPTATAAIPVKLELEDDFAEGSMNKPLSIPVLLNDIIPEDGQAEGGFAIPKHGRLEPAADGLMYIPETDFCGHDSFDYEISMGDLSDLATVTVHILCPEPSTTNDRVSILQDSGPVVVEVLENDVLYGSGVLRVDAILYDATHGKCDIVNGGNAISYTPKAGYHGHDNCVYNSCNDADGCDAAALTINVLQDNVAIAALTSQAQSAETKETMAGTSVIGAAAGAVIAIIGIAAFVAKRNNERNNSFKSSDNSVSSGESTEVSLSNSDYSGKIKSSFVPSKMIEFARSKNLTVTALLSGESRVHKVSPDLEGQMVPISPANEFSLPSAGLSVSKKNAAIDDIVDL